MALMTLHPYTTDTTTEALEVQLEAFRRMSPAERIRKVCRLSADLRRMAFEAIRRRHPEYDEHQTRLKFIEITYGKELADAVGAHLRNRGHE